MDKHTRMENLRLRALAANEFPARYMPPESPSTYLAMIETIVLYENVLNSIAYSEASTAVEAEWSDRAQRALRRGKERLGAG